MQKIVTFIFVILLSGLTAQGQSSPCLPNGITFIAQEEITNFAINHPECITIEGDVNIAAYNTYGSAITDLTGLQQIQSIQGDLTIVGHSSLPNLQGLNHLSYLGGSLYIADNIGFNSLSGLDGLTTVNGNMYIRNNSTLTSIDALHVLNTIGGDLYISRMHGLVSLNGLSSLHTLGRNLILENNTELTSLSSLSALDTIGGRISITSCPMLQSLANLSGIHNLNSDLILSGTGLLNLAGLNHITTVGNNFTIEANPLMTDLTGLDQLQHVGGSINITTNNRLHHLSGLDSLQYVGWSVSIDSNDSLENLIGLGHINHIGADFLIRNNTALSNFLPVNQLQKVGDDLIIYNNRVLHTLSGLDSLHSINGLLWINYNHSLNDLSALSALVSVGKTVDISFNDSLTTLNGLQNLRIVGTDISIYNNELLTNITALANVDSIGSMLGIFDNPSLSLCSIFPVCDYAFNHPALLTISGNAPGCDSPEAVEELCGGRPVLATVLIDYNGNCQSDTGDTPADGVLVRLYTANQQVLRPTQSNGITSFGYLDTGMIMLTLSQLPDANWQVCADTSFILPDSTQDTIRAVFLLRPLELCPRLTVDLGLPPFFRGCLVNTGMQVTTRNIGTVPATDARVALVMPPFLQVVSSVPTIAAQSGDTLFFDLGNIAPFVASTVHLIVKTACDAALIEQEALCLEAFATWNNPCPVPPASEIRLFSTCMNDTTVRFTIKNVGNAPTQNVHDYVIIEDEVILRSANFSLDPLDTLIVDVPSNGATYRMEATQYDDGSLTATALESCNGFTPGFITAYWLNEGLRSYDFDCREVRIAYDPNQKTAIPTGVGPENLLAANKSIQYTIDFQNTGQDTAFRVRLRDVLPVQLNVNTFRPVASSNPYTWQIVGADTLEVLFQPIMLPDSNVNEAASHGWFSFNIAQKPDLPDGTVIENTASIIFDYNPPIITNTVQHTIGKLIVSVDDPLPAGQTWQVLSNPARYTAIFRSIDFIAGEKRFELADALGRIVRTEHFSSQLFEFQRNNLSGGLYYFRIYDTHGKVTTGKIVFSE